MTRQTGFIGNLFGKRPYQYRYEKTGAMNKEVYANTYSLSTGDWFESGTRFAYSLHKKEESALKYKPFNWWFPNQRAKLVFVSNKTLEAITKERKGLFVSEEE